MPGLYRPVERATAYGALATCSPRPASLLRPLTILPALLVEKCQALSQGQSHPQGTSPITGVLRQVVAQGTLEESRGRSRAHRAGGITPGSRELLIDPTHQPAPPWHTDALTEPGQDTTDSGGIGLRVSQSDRKISNASWPDTAGLPPQHLASERRGSGTSQSWLHNTLPKSTHAHACPPTHTHIHTHIITVARRRHTHGISALKTQKQEAPTLKAEHGGGGA